MINELELLLDKLPNKLVDLIDSNHFGELTELVIDLGRAFEYRIVNFESIITEETVSDEDIKYITSKLPAFPKSGRVGIDHTLHRISAVFSTTGEIIGLTIRVGKNIDNFVHIIEDLLPTKPNVLIIGPPSVGKTTIIRSIAFLLGFSQRVIVIDKSGEIGGYGNIPHHGIGESRRLHIPPNLTYDETITFGLESHTPETIILDEVSNLQEALACCTISQRGVQLIATAHGDNIKSIIRNPTIKVLMGNPKSVTLTDEEAARRGCQKTVLEREFDPSFDVVVEIVAHDIVKIYRNIDQVIDCILQKGEPVAEERRIMGNKIVTVEKAKIPVTNNTIADRARIVSKARK